MSTKVDEPHEDPELAQGADSQEDPYPSAPTMEIAVASAPHGWAIEIQDEGKARCVPLSRERLIVGSAPSADILVRDPTVSGRHCALSPLSDGVAIEDLGSRNGTFVGGARIREARGHAGTAVALGSSTIVIEAVELGDTTSEPGAPLPGVAGKSLVVRRLADHVRRLATHSLPVLVSGESGSGKELVARAIHSHGPRREHPFVAINVTALPRELVESELFGHERGAFTGAYAKRLGAFAEAEGGTLFLDEVGDLPLEAQPKLLRALDGYEVRRVGASGGGKPADARVVAATHAALASRVEAGQFRRDLFHRLECFVVHVPPLRERRGDIAAIARELLCQIEAQVGRSVLSPAAAARLAVHDWPGNVRELRNVLCRAADATRSSGRIDAEDVERALRPHAMKRPLPLSPQVARAMLRDHQGNLSAAARGAGLPRTTFRKLLRA